MVGQMPNGWARVSLGDVAEINPRADRLVGVKTLTFLAMADVSETGELLNQTRVALSDANVQGYTRFRRGDILCAKITPCFENGKGGSMAGLLTEYGFGSTEFHVMRAGEKILPRLLHHIVQSSEFRRRGEQFMTGSAGQKRVPADFIADYALLLPPLEEQHRIVALMDAADRQIALSEQLAFAADAHARTVINELVDGVEADHVPLDAVVSRVRRAPENDQALPLTISASAGLVPQSRFFGKRVAAESIDTYTLLKRDEFAYNKSYSSGYPYGAIKRLELVDEGILSSLYLCFAIKDQREVSLDYMAAVFDSGFFNRQLHMIAHEGARNHGLLNVSADDFFAMRFPLPRHGDQQRISKIVRLLLARSIKYQGRVRACKEQKRGLMQLLLSGEKRLLRDLPGMEHAA